MSSVARQMDVFRMNLPQAVGHRLRREFEHLPAAHNDPEALLAELLRTASHVPPKILRALLWFRSAPDAPGALLLTGMPIDEELQPTPTKPIAPSLVPAPAGRCAILLVAILLGEPVAYAGEKQGALVQNVFPTRAEQAAPSNESSAVALEFHTELAFSRIAPEQSFDVAAPDFILLFCLRSEADRAATTSIVEARDLSRRLPPAQLAVLRQPLFQLRAPYSFTHDSDGPRPWSPPCTLVRGPSEDPEVAFDISCGVRALSPEAEDALEALRGSCSDPEIQRHVELRPGDLLAIDNRRCAHARSRYKARFDGHDRWLQRVYVRHSIRSLRRADKRWFRVLA